MPDSGWLARTSPAFQLMIATSWLAPQPWRDKQEQAIRRCFASGIDWTEFVGLVDRHRTPGSSWAALKRTPGIVLPESATRELTRRSDQCRLQALQHLQILLGILRLLHRAGIPAMVLKGPLLSLDLYEDAALRQSRDLDLLVPQEHIPEAEKQLEQTGWRRGSDYPSLTPRQWQLTLKVEHHVGYVDPKSGCLLELHWRASWDTAEMTANRWARSLPITRLGCTYRAMDPANLALYLANHGGEHAWFRAKWLGDVARLYTNGVDWEQIWDFASATDQARAVFLCLKLLEDIYGLPMPAAAAPFSEQQPSKLLKKCLHDIQADLSPRNAVWRFVDGIRQCVHHQRIWPYRSWIAEFTFCRKDFSVLCLPDRLLWLYAPLRPFLWTWRRMFS